MKCLYILVYNVDSITVAKITGIKILPSDWDEKKQMVRAKNRNAAHLTNYNPNDRKSLHKHLQNIRTWIMKDRKYKSEVEDAEIIIWTKNNSNGLCDTHLLRIIKAICLRS